jgi:hypothetical protein
MFNPLKQFRIIDKVKKEEEEAKKRKHSPSIPAAAESIVKLNRLHKNPGK